MATIAFVEKETGLQPCHPLDVREGNIFYLVQNGERGPVQKAVGPAQAVGPVADGRWDIPAEEVE